MNAAVPGFRFLLRCLHAFIVFNTIFIKRHMLTISSIAYTDNVVCSHLSLPSGSKGLYLVIKVQSGDIIVCFIHFLSTIQSPVRRGVGLSPARSHVNV